MMDSDCKNTSRRSGQRPKKRKKGPINRHVATRQSRRAKRQKLDEEPRERSLSASERKLNYVDAVVSEDRKGWNGLRVIDIDKVFSDILGQVICKKCRSNQPLTISEVKTVGLSSKFVLTCTNRKCGALKSFRSCNLVNNQESEANARIVYVSQLLGIRYEGLKKLHAFMDFPQPISSTFYSKIIKKIHSAVMTEAEDNMLAAIKEEVDIEGSTDISVSGDGSWQKRGFSSKNGFVSLIGKHTGKVVDVEVMTTVCHGCSNYKGPKEGVEYEEWKEAHTATCSINHDGSAGMMEVVGMKRAFKRSVDRAGVRYLKYIGDGDAKTYASVVADKPYGDNVVISKLECTGHVQKRMGKRLRDVKKNWKGKKLSDGKSISGQGRLTDKRIDMLSTFYGVAIRSSKTVKEMKDNVWAIYEHYRSTDAKPQHRFCPKGKDSWCKYQKAVFEKTTKNFKHKSSIPVAVMDAIKPTFTELTKPDLLKRCLGGHTQNPNEALNAVVWKNVPKTVFCGKSVLEIGVADGVIVFNSGQRGRLKGMERFGVVPGKHCVFYANSTDWARVEKSKKRSLDSTKEARRKKRLQEKDSQEKLASVEGDVYLAGAY